MSSPQGLSSSPPTRPPKRSLLLVEDDVDIRTSLIELLNLEGYEVSYASNGMEALNQLQKDPLPGLILLDMTMPVMDGRTFLSNRNQIDRLRSIPVILFSATTQLETVGDVAAIVKKPVDIDELLIEVRKHHKS